MRLLCPDRKLEIEGIFRAAKNEKRWTERAIVRNLKVAMDVSNFDSYRVCFLVQATCLVRTYHSFINVLAASENAATPVKVLHGGGRSWICSSAFRVAYAIPVLGSR